MSNKLITDQQIYVVFGIIVKGDEQDPTKLAKMIQNDENLLAVKARIVALYCVDFSTLSGKVSLQNIWLFAAMVPEGKYEGKVMVGFYHAGFRIGGCELI